ncbi:type I-E CRISPR-associated protein Cse1/CasA [Leptolyngbya sp. GB1-A1]|uniref:type I-E CRISPR-associated protein Cse1/CasA n=1 Tax=Leptolyngbya sp. GB1-A1 TaxID=2933908 RepID=UPI00329738CF
MMTFNLVDQPWLLVVSQDWQRRDVSLIELFTTWETLKEIQADNPPTTLAIYRFLLAVLHRAYQGPKDVDHWEEIQQDNGKKAIAYLNQWRDRFDLFHPDYPFMQDTALTKDKAVPIYAIHTMSTSKVFSHEHEWSGYRVSPPEAARLMVRLQSVDITSLRAFYPPQSSGNRSAVNTPTINNSNVLVVGTTLKGTLLLNLMQYYPEGEIPSVVSGEDLPTWEMSYAGKPAKTVPNGYIHYLTYPWRRLNLVPDSDGMSQLAITMGNSFPDEISPQQWECGIAFHEDKPVRFSPTRQLWRNAHSFLQSAEKNHRPRIIDWLATLHAEGLVEDVVHLQVFGMCADKAKPLACSVERFSAPAIYITDKQLGASLKTMIAITEDNQHIFRFFQSSPYYELAKGLNPPTTNSKAIGEQARQLAEILDGESRYWATLDRAFQTLLRELPADKTVDGNGITYGNTKLPEWTKTVQSAARDAFTASISPIRNYEARAKALRALEWKLSDLRATPEEKEAKKAKAAKKKDKVSQ